VIKVLVVDDSAVVRKVLSEELSRLPDIEVVATAMDPYVARDRIAEQKPDVITLDLEMPRMDGLSFLAKLMRHMPLPVVVVSSMAPENSENAFRALELGAVEVVPKPGSRFSVPDVGRLLARAVRAAARARVAPSPATPEGADAPARERTTFSGLAATTHKVLAVGASTGGTRALESIFRALPGHTPGTVVVQHMPQGFTRLFAERLDSLCAMEIREARSGEAVVPGTCLIAPGGHHMVLVRSGARYEVELRDTPPVHHQRPAVDVLFESVARHAGANAVGVLLTGMGQDGAAGLERMQEAGAPTLAQDEETSVVWGMPGAAVARGAADRVVALPDLPREIGRCLDAASAPVPRPTT
jgi:two-component system chemotaxis response regulator CheB